MEGGSVVDSDGVVHAVEWVSGPNIAADDGGWDFTISCRAKLYSLGTPYFVPVREKPTCLECLAQQV